MQVHKTLGAGFQEKIYQRAMAIELGHACLSFEREKETEIYYREEVIGTRRVDFFVEAIVLMELKAMPVLDKSHLAQTLNYLEVFKLDIGLLINFGGRSLEFKRIQASWSGP